MQHIERTLFCDICGKSVQERNYQALQFIVSEGNRAENKRKVYQDLCPECKVDLDRFIDNIDEFMPKNTFHVKDEYGD
jgi:hypothetical protein